MNTGLLQFDPRKFDIIYYTIENGIFKTIIVNIVFKTFNTKCFFNNLNLFLNYVSNFYISNSF